MSISLSSEAGHDPAALRYSVRRSQKSLESSGIHSFLARAKLTGHLSSTHVEHVIAIAHHPVVAETISLFHAKILGITLEMGITFPGWNDSVAENVASLEEVQIPWLTVKQLREAWARILSRLSTRKNGNKVAAVLRSYTVIEVNMRDDPPVIVLKAPASFHFRALQESTEHQAALRWAIKVELEQECLLRILPPSL